MEIFKKRNFSGSTLDFLHSGNEVFIYQVWAFSSLNIMNSNARDVAVKLYSTYTIASIVFLSQLGYFLSNFYQLHVLMRALRTYDIMILGGMNGKSASKNFFWKCILCTEGKNDEMGISSSRERSQLNNTCNKQFTCFAKIINLSYVRKYGKKLELIWHVSL